MTMQKTDRTKIGVLPVEFTSINGGQPQIVQGEVVDETLSCISVNGVELATFMCSPTQLDLLAIGFLYNENLIANRDEIETIHQSENDCIDIWLNKPFEKPARKIITAGCGGGVTFDDLTKKHPPLDHKLTVSADDLIQLMRRLHFGAALYQRSRGIHTAVLATAKDILIQVEDVGRHNCIDKIAGAAITQQVDPAGKILLSSGRISSEMINKARRLGVPIICSRTSPTSLSVALAQSWNMTIVAYLRQNRMRIYTHPENIITSTPSTLSPGDANE